MILDHNNKKDKSTHVVAMKHFHSYLVANPEIADAVERLRRQKNLSVSAILFEILSSFLQLAEDKSFADIAVVARYYRKNHKASWKDLISSATDAYLKAFKDSLPKKVKKEETKEDIFIEI